MVSTRDPHTALGTWVPISQVGRLTYGGFSYCPKVLPVKRQNEDCKAYFLLHSQRPLIKDQLFLWIDLQGVSACPHFCTGTPLRPQAPVRT